MLTHLQVAGEHFHRSHRLDLESFSEENIFNRLSPEPFFPHDVCLVCLFVCTAKFVILFGVSEKKDKGSVASACEFMRALVNQHAGCDFVPIVKPVS